MEICQGLVDVVIDDQIEGFVVFSAAYRLAAVVTAHALTGVGVV
jgi:hypothetical protein